MITISMLYVFFTFPCVYFLYFQLPCYTYTLYFRTYVFFIFDFHAIHILYISLHIFSSFSTSMLCIYFIFPYTYFLYFQVPCCTNSLYCLYFHFIMNRKNVSVEKYMFRYVRASCVTTNFDDTH